MVAAAAISIAAITAWARNGAERRVEARMA
jgi:hypothetical protein